MEHPLLFEEGDALVERIRSLCLGLPEAVETLNHGRPSWKAGEKGRAFAALGAPMDRPDTLVFKPDPAEAPAWREDPRVFVPKYWGPSGWLAIDLDRGTRDWSETSELIETSYRQVALRRQLAVLDAVM
ncbi:MULTISPECIES: MmcQ/YjbR family DNA-binding protein [unclassified Leifsonia]|uniref:MmcQ/YjbR family DNA-binding protein n=1 Tax=unclassified Leifsonia TaxID=2663824 RepID=UPI00037CD739|nr:MULTISPECIES: MmcQ/YjbR family DNA-binding protein [unclassified Leifsonia]TDQ02157.1 putative DNA-binding protein (MmcQ/YjbR family) [Leifsonia sp. 115AMFTsu3.1]